MNELLEQKAKELAQLITETDEYQEVRIRQQKMFADKECLNLLNEFTQLQNANLKKQEQGKLTQEDIKAMEQAELKLYENQLIKEFHEAQTDLQRLLNSVMQVIVENTK